MNLTENKYSQLFDQWPPYSLKRNYSGPQAEELFGYGLALMSFIKRNVQLTGIPTGRLERVLPDGTRIVADTRFGHDILSITRPGLKEEVVEIFPDDWMILYLISLPWYDSNGKHEDFRMFYVSIKTGKKVEIKKPIKFWNDDDYYEGPLDAPDGFGSGTSVALNNFQKSDSPLSLNTVTYPKWNIVIDDNWNFTGLQYFPIMVMMNVPGGTSHTNLGLLCFDPPVCFSAIITGNACFTCFAFWPFRGTLPLLHTTYNFVPNVLVPLIRYEKDSNGDDQEIFEWKKKDQIWSRGAITYTPRVDVTGKSNYNIVTSEKGTKHALNYRESIVDNGQRGQNIHNGTWWNQVLAGVPGYHAPCDVDITHGFGGDGAYWWPFWTWLHETPTTGIPQWSGYAYGTFGLHTREAIGWDMHWLKYDPLNPEEDPVEETIPLLGLDENFIRNDSVCIRNIVYDTAYGPGVCDYRSGTRLNSVASGNYSGKFFFPVATLGGKRFIYFQNIFSGVGGQTHIRETVSYETRNYKGSGCYTVSSCCTAGGMSCFGSYPNCGASPPLSTEQGSEDSNNGDQHHSFTVNQTFQIGKVMPDKSIENVIIDTGLHQYNHQLNVSTLSRSGVSVRWQWGQYDDFWKVCPCAGVIVNSPASYLNTETETYFRNIKTFEVVDYASNPFNDDVAIIYKKILIIHACSTTGNGATTHWTHSGTRVVTWHLYVNISRIDNTTNILENYSKTFDLTPTFTATRSGGEDGGHAGSGSRVWGASLQLNDDYLAYSFLSENWGGLGGDFGGLTGQKMYPGPMNLEDRNVEPLPFFEFDNVGCVWNTDKQYFGMVDLSKGLNHQEWSVTPINPDTGDSEGANIGTKKVYTVGLLAKDPEEPVVE